MILQDNSESPETNSFATYIQLALESGELSPAAEAYFQSLLQRGTLSDRQQQMLKLLQDAIEDGCVRRITLETDI